MDINKVDYSGGSLDGQGAAGAVTATNDIGYDNNGTVITEAGGDQAYKKNAGCPLCFSKNGSKNRAVIQTPTPRPKIGF